ncbi:glycosyltransferase [Herbiconiux moechotypicola]|uniref:D-inositol 3-phosphate glycosyltransferase n=1 Tax=Herbiconiux moechotypicola TaxID=637393 RepID=A0ABN3DB51_9MICO|nr:glycosyltransferase [Herbiconiux moechotypicola]MCS5728914.1 glycosyltransferase [Herbiconiux moechotypicola]
MRLALVSLHTSPLARPGEGDAGGMNVVLVGLADALTASGVEAVLVTRAESPDAPGRVAHTAGGTPVHRLAAGPLAPVAKSALPPLVPEFARALAGLGRFDVVHSNYWLSGLAGLPVARATGAPHVLSLHTVAALKNSRLAAGDRPEPAARLEAERMLVRDSDLTLAHTEAERSAILDHDEASPERVAVVPPGVDTTLFHPDPATHRGDRRPYLLVLARIQPLKGVDLALRAFALLPSQARPRLVVAGGVSPGHEAYGDELERLARELGVADTVDFLGPRSREQAAELLRGADLLLVPSHSETFGLVALEAAASGTPVVAASSTGLLDSVEDGVSGLLLPSREPVLWAAAIGRLLDHPSRLRELSRTAQAFGARRSWSAVAADTLRHYEALLATPTHPEAP